MTYCNHSNQKNYPFILPELPYDKNDLNPYLSAESFEYHHEKHHNAYVNNLNDLIKDDKNMHDKDLEEIILSSNKSNPAIFNNAAQIWNHTFFWNSMKSFGGGEPTGEIAERINKDFGSYDEFKSQFKQAALTQFGSGWAWLACKDDKLVVLKTPNAENPLTQGYKPLIACDVWEHAYYIDYRNKRPDFVTTFIDHLINWDFANAHLLQKKI